MPPAGHMCARSVSQSLHVTARSVRGQRQKTSMMRPRCASPQWPCCPMLPCTNTWLPMRHCCVTSKKAETKRQPRHVSGRRTNNTSVPPSHKISFLSVHFLKFGASLLPTQKGYCGTAVFFYRKGRSNILKPMYNMLDVSCAMKNEAFRAPTHCFHSNIP